MSQYVIYVGSTTDGKVYKQIVCSCGHQNTSGTCPHVSSALIIEHPDGTREWVDQYGIYHRDRINFFNIK